MLVTSPGAKTEPPVHLEERAFLEPKGSGAAPLFASPFHGCSDSSAKSFSPAPLLAPSVPLISAQAPQLVQGRLKSLSSDRRIFSEQDVSLTRMQVEDTTSTAYSILGRSSRATRWPAQGPSSRKHSTALAFARLSHFSRQTSTRLQLLGRIQWSREQSSRGATTGRSSTPGKLSGSASAVRFRVRYRLTFDVSGSFSRASCTIERK
mmetsp:Transcript_16655/g.47244  ORF Transcript_16655/g.47244 Transcript_16655/m.47244 type:complete len:207 (+) Transcript_16655:331-951(+)